MRQLLDPDLLDDVDVEALGLEPFQVETTGPDGAAMQPFCRRAGRVIKVLVAASPRSHLMPRWGRAGVGKGVWEVVDTSPK